MKIEKIEAVCPNCQKISVFNYQFRDIKRNGLFNFTHAPEVVACPINSCGKYFVLEIVTESQHLANETKLIFTTKTFQIVEPEQDNLADTSQAAVCRTAPMPPPITDDTGFDQRR